MISKQEKLQDVVVKSFITKLSTEDQKTIQGGKRGNDGDIGTTSMAIFC